MPITQEQAVQAVSRNGERFKISDADFNAGQDDGTSLSTGDVGEIGVAEVGEDGQLSDYSAVLIGQPPRNSGLVQGNEAFVNPGGTTVNDTTQWALAVKRRGDPGPIQENNPTGWIYRRSSNTSTNSEQVKIPPAPPVARQGREVVYIIKDESTGPQVSLSSSVVEVPAIGGDI